MCNPFKIHNKLFGAPARSWTQNLLVRSDTLCLEYYHCRWNNSTISQERINFVFPLI